MFWYLPPKSWICFEVCTEPDTAIQIVMFEMRPFATRNLICKVCFDLSTWHLAENFHQCHWATESYCKLHWNSTRRGSWRAAYASTNAAANAPTNAATNATGTANAACTTSSSTTYATATYAANATSTAFASSVWASFICRNLVDRYFFPNDLRGPQHLRGMCKKKCRCGKMQRGTVQPMDDLSHFFVFWRWSLAFLLFHPSLSQNLKSLDSFPIFWVPKKKKVAPPLIQRISKVAKMLDFQLSNLPEPSTSTWSIWGTPCSPRLDKIGWTNFGMCKRLVNLVYFPMNLRFFGGDIYFYHLVEAFCSNSLVQKGFNKQFELELALVTWCHFENLKTRIWFWINRKTLVQQRLGNTPHL